MRNSIEDAERQSDENDQLQFFLGNATAIMTHLKKEMIRLSGYEDGLFHLMTFCANMYESERYVVPTEKHALLRVMTHCILLMDDGEKDVRALYKRKKVNIDRFFKLFKVCAKAVVWWCERQLLLLLWAWFVVAGGRLVVDSDSVSVCECVWGTVCCLFFAWLANAGDSAVW